MPYITSGGAIYYGKKQRKDHRKIPEPPDNTSKFDGENWVKNNEKAQKKQRLEMRSKMRQPVKTSCGACITPFGPAHNALLYNINKGLNSFKIMDDTGAVLTLTAKDAVDVDKEIQTVVQEVLA